MTTSRNTSTSAFCTRSARITSSGGVLVLALPLGKHDHDCGHKTCSKAVWSVPELRYMHASDHCRPLVRNLALWSRSLQALAWISFAGASVDAAHIEPSRNAVARSSPTQYLGGMMVNTYLLDLAPAYEQYCTQRLEPCTSTLACR